MKSTPHEAGVQEDRRPSGRSSFRFWSSRCTSSSNSLSAVWRELLQEQRPAFVFGERRGDAVAPA